MVNAVLQMTFENRLKSMGYNQIVLSHLQNFWINHEIKGFSWELGRVTEELPDFQVFQVIPNHEDEPRPLQKSLSPNSRNPNTGFRLFSPQITPNFTQIPP